MCHLEAVCLGTFQSPKGEEWRKKALPPAVASEMKPPGKVKLSVLGCSLLRWCFSMPGFPKMNTRVEMKESRYHFNSFKLSNHLFMPSPEAQLSLSAYIPENCEDSILSAFALLAASGNGIIVISTQYFKRIVYFLISSSKYRQPKVLVAIHPPPSLFYSLCVANVELENKRETPQRRFTSELNCQAGDPSGLISRETGSFVDLRVHQPRRNNYLDAFSQLSIVDLYLQCLHCTKLDPKKRKTRKYN